VLWGLETVALLVEQSVSTAKAAEEIARAIPRAKPRFITEDVIARFLERIGLAPKKSPKRKAPKKAK
jgi:hypothetical protein